jgi:hypothetical protein
VFKHFDLSGALASYLAANSGCSTVVSGIDPKALCTWLHKVLILNHVEGLLHSRRLSHPRIPSVQKHPSNKDHNLLLYG